MALRICAPGKTEYGRSVQDHCHTVRNEGMVLGQKYAYATAALMVGIAGYIQLLGIERALLARRVMEQSEHVLLAGPGASAFARSVGIAASKVYDRRGLVARSAQALLVAKRVLGGLQLMDVHRAARIGDAGHGGQSKLGGERAILGFVIRRVANRLANFFKTIARCSWSSAASRRVIVGDSLSRVWAAAKPSLISRTSSRPRSPSGIFIARGYFESLPGELSESGLIDGASHFMICLICISLHR